MQELNVNQTETKKTSISSSSKEPLLFDTEVSVEDQLRVLEKNLATERQKLDKLIIEMYTQFTVYAQAMQNLFTNLK